MRAHRLTVFETMTRQEKIEFIRNVAPAAQASQKKLGVPASITIAQAILESSDVKGNWGRSGLALKCNNYFGIKARAGEEYQQFLTTEYRNGIPRKELAKFRTFRTLQDCFDRHATLLSSADRYQPAMKVASDPLAFALQLQQCGYATDPAYAKKLTDLMVRWDLTKYDAPREGA